MNQNAPKHFFISYNKTDRAWAEWIAWQLEEAGYTTIIQVWDFRPGMNFVQKMHEAVQEAERTIAVLSTNYLEALYTYPEWEAAFKQDPKGDKGILVPVRIQECKPLGLLGPITYIDLVRLDEAAAYQTLLDGVRQGRNKPPTAPLFPGKMSEGQRTVPQQPLFPGALPLKLPPIWNIPYARNPLFTGRENVLKRVSDALRASKTAAISGLGGIGKTQTAVEYAYRYQDDYNTILWVKAEILESIISDFVTIAHLLNLPEKQEQEQRLIVEAVKRWFKGHAGWLLIFDNADDLTMVRDFLPIDGNGYTLLTTRMQATRRIAQRIEIEEMDQEEGALFLLRRATILDPDAPLEAASIADRATAREIVQVMDGLPLALDQAGAYIEDTQCGLTDYLHLFQTRQEELLHRRGKLTTDHPDSVATTWSLAFEKVQQANPAAADLLRLCTFLDPDIIQEEIITEGASELGSVLQPVASDPIKLNDAIGTLLSYSLVRRNPDHKLSIHRLVQVVLKHSMNKSVQRRWAERAVRAVNQAFPKVDYENWLRCQEYIPQVLTCNALIEQWDMVIPEAAQLLNEGGLYLRLSAQYELAELLLQRTLAIRERVLGAEAPDTADSLNDLAELYRDQGKYEQAESLNQRTLAIRERMLGPDHPNTAISLNNLGVLFDIQGKYEEAEPLYQRALSIHEKAYGTEHSEVATVLNNLATLYQDQGRYEEAEPLYQRALAIDEKVLGPEHPWTATILNYLANLYRDRGKYEEAEPLYQRALAIDERVLGPNHPNTVRTRENYAFLKERMNEENT